MEENLHLFGCVKPVVNNVQRNQYQVPTWIFFGDLPSKVLTTGTKYTYPPNNLEFSFPNIDALWKVTNPCLKSVVFFWRGGIYSSNIELTCSWMVAGQSGGKDAERGGQWAKNLSFLVDFFFSNRRCLSKKGPCVFPWEKEQKDIRCWVKKQVFIFTFTWESDPIWPAYVFLMGGSATNENHPLITPKDAAEFQAFHFDSVENLEIEISYWCWTVGNELEAY